MKKIVAAIAVIFVLTSCKNIKEPELIGIENVDAGQFSLMNSSIGLGIKLHNPNKFPARLKEAAGDAYIENSLLGHFTIDTTIIAPAKSDFVVPVKLSLNTGFILQQAMSLMQKDSIVVEIKGNAKAARGNFFKNFPLNYKVTQNLKDLLNVQ